MTSSTREHPEWLEGVFSVIARVDDLVDSLNGRLASEMGIVPGGKENLQSAALRICLLAIKMEALVISRYVTKALPEPSPKLAEYHENSEFENESLGHQLLDAVEYTTNPEMGLFGFQRSLFPVRLMLYSFRAGTHLHNRGLKAYQSFHHIAGLNHATSLDKRFSGIPSLELNIELLQLRSTRHV